MEDCWEMQSLFCTREEGKQTLVAIMHHDCDIADNAIKIHLLNHAPDP